MDMVEILQDIEKKKKIQLHILEELRALPQDRMVICKPEKFNLELNVVINQALGKQTTEKNTYFISSFFK